MPFVTLRGHGETVFSVVGGGPDYIEVEDAKGNKSSLVSGLIYARGYDKEETLAEHRRMKRINAAKEEKADEEKAAEARAAQKAANAASYEGNLTALLKKQASPSHALSEEDEKEIKALTDGVRDAIFHRLTGERRLATPIIETILRETVTRIGLAALRTRLEQIFEKNEVVLVQKEQSGLKEWIILMNPESAGAAGGAGAPPKGGYRRSKSQRRRNNKRKTNRRKTNRKTNRKY